MVYKRFYVIIVIRSILLALNAAVLFYFWWQPGLNHLKLLLALLFILQVILLIWFLNRINRKLSSFFDSIRSDDYSMVFSGEEKSVEFTGLNQQLDKLSRYFQKLKLDNEQKNLYFKAVIDHVATGILSFDQDGKVNFINLAALKMLELESLRNIKSLDEKQPGLTDQLMNIQPGTQQLIDVPGQYEVLQLSARSVIYKQSEEQLTLVSLQNIRPELELKETQTWQKLIRVLTHEIMNSVSPITSLAASLSKIIDVKGEEGTDARTASKLSRGLNIIKGRGEGLVEFVTSYRELTVLPEPQLSRFVVLDLVHELKVLFDEELKKSNITFQIEVVPMDLELNADRKMIEQVFINLVKNAVFALKDAEIKNIVFHAFVLDAKQLIIRLSDTGAGISQEDMDKIFIPFYTTHESGSGIGLSLSRQIMMMHKGSITARSKPGLETVFELVFQP